MTGRRRSAKWWTGTRAKKSRARPREGAARARDPVGHPALLSPEVGERLAVMVVVGVEARVEDEPVAGGRGVGAEGAVLAAVALVPAKGRVARDGDAVRGEERDVARLPQREERRLALEVGDPAPGGAAVEGSGTADQRARVFLERAGKAGGPPAVRGNGVRVQEDDDRGGCPPPADVAGAPGEGVLLQRDDRGPLAPPRPQPCRRWSSRRRR